jgi:hypothetical protein
MSLRDVVEDPLFTEDLDNLRNVYSQIDDVHDGLTWALSNDPRIGVLIPQTHDYRLYITTATSTTPAFWVMYRFDAEKVYLYSIKEFTE